MVNTVKNLLIMLNNLLSVHFKHLHKKQLKKKKKKKEPAEPTGDLTGNTIADKITSLKNFTTECLKHQNIKLDREIPKERYMFLEKRKKNYW